VTFAAKREAPILLGLSIVFLAINLITSTRYPAVWVDEIQFADPAVNLVLHGEFSSSAWIVQTSHEFWAGNAPLYTVMLSQWLRLFGVSALAVRSMNYVLMLAVVWLIWFLARRKDWIGQPNLRLALAVLLMTGQGMMFAYRTGRYDVVGMLLFATTAFFWPAAPDGRARLFPIAVVAAVMPLAGLQLIPAALLLGVLTLAFQGRIALPAVIATGAGLVVGAGLLYAFYASHGVWRAFRASTSAVGVVGQGIGFKIETLPHSFWYDKSELLLLAAAAVLVWGGRHAGLRQSVMLFAITAALLIPASLHMAAKFPIYYSWMVFIPLAIAVFRALGSAAVHPPARRVAWVVIAMAGLAGLPLRLAAVGLNWAFRSQAPISQFVSDNLKPDDVVVADFKAYYPVKLNCKALFALPYLGVMTAPESASVTALLIQPSDLAVASRAVGPGWRDAGRTMSGSQTGTKWLLPILKDFQQEEYAVKLYRR
jgi:hypothetical protein